ncbi:hypothetical protein LJB86_02850 [Deltaproteobacteria bacterium OttesenSCG-928-M10]|nr:hypothetical protein [Deltaproteobacteria bacterium OttesenSCG-928-M10]
MRNMKLATIAATLALAVFMGSASIASAWGGHNGAFGPDPQDARAEQQALYNDHEKNATSLVSQLRAKQTEMEALSARPTQDTFRTQLLAQNRAETLTKEISDIQGRLYRLDSELESQMRDSDAYASDNYGWEHRNSRGSGGHYGGHG